MKKQVILVFLLGCSNTFSCSQELEFPAEFKFGVATSAYQIEGAWNEDGKTPSVLDETFHQVPEIVKDRSNGDVACDSYHKVDEDIAMIKSLGLDFYRFSLSWTRLLPDGYTTNVNPAGVDYYNRLINGLLANGIQPMVTLYHWDYPQVISRLGGVTNSEFVKYFENYANIAFSLFGDRVKTWITFNEPHSFCVVFNEAFASFYPVYPKGVIEYLCAINVIKAHARAYHLYKNKYYKHQQGKIGISLNFEWGEPTSDKQEDIDAAKRQNEFQLGLFLNPLVRGDYPKVVKKRVDERSAMAGFPQSRLVEFSLIEKFSIARTYDFIGLNYYSTWLIQDAPEASNNETGFSSDIRVNKLKDPSWEKEAIEGFTVVPWGLRKALKWIKDEYRNPEIVITECGYAGYANETLQDDRRINLYKEYLDQVLLSIHEDRVKVTGFTAWSIMDNFEWSNGYTAKFGLYRVDFESPERTRTPKASADYIKNVVATRKTA